MNLELIMKNVTMIRSGEKITKAFRSMTSFLNKLSLSKWTTIIILLINKFNNNSNKTNSSSSNNNNSYNKIKENIVLISIN